MDIDYYKKLNIGKNFKDREFVFFSVLIISIFLKFYFLEYAISLYPTRHFPSAAASLGIALCLVVPVSLLWRKIRPFAVFLADFLLTALVITDLLYMRYYSDLFTFGNIGLTTQVNEIAESVFALFHSTDFLYFIDIPVLIIYIIMFRKRTNKPFFNKVTFKRFVLSMFLLLFGSLCIFWRISSYQKVMPQVLRSMWDRPAVCNNVGAMTYHVVDAWNITSDYLLRRPLSQDKIEEIAAWFSQRNASDAPRGEFYGISAGKNLIVIQVESLQQFVVGLKINGEEVTPNINKFVKESVYFSRVYNQTSTGNSSDAEFLVNAALYPSASGVAYTRFSANVYEALPKMLLEHGYSTLALHGDRPGFWNRQHMYPSMGFERFISKKDFNVDESIGMGLSDASFFRQTLDILDKERKPFYAFLVTLTSHYPYNFEQIFEQTKLDVGDFEGILMGNYLTSMRYFDTQFGLFIEGLRKKKLLDSSVIIVYGDHTAIPIWDRQNLEKLLGRSLAENWEWREILKIPLIIRVPGKKLSGENKNLSGLVDVADTAAGLLGLRFRMGFGRYLLGGNKQEPVIFRNGSFIIENVFVDPSNREAIDIGNGKKLDYECYVNITNEVKKRLSYNDSILEHDLIPKLINIERKK